MNAETIFTNAVLVLPDEVRSGTLTLRGDMIAKLPLNVRLRRARSISMATTSLPAWLTCTRIIWNARYCRAAWRDGRRARRWWHTMRNARLPA